MNHPERLLTVCMLALVGACGSSAPTVQLVDARRAYNDAAASDAAKLTPDRLLSARQALDRAEVEHRDDPGSSDEAHLGYLASRKAAMAIAMGKIAAAEKSEDQAEAEYQKKLQQLASSGQAELQRSKRDLATEQAARAEADRRAAAAFASLQEVARINEEQRGTVITLPGGVLFPSGGHALSAAARTALDKVAQALTEQVSGRQVTIEGHTDSRGADDMNLELSQKRAEAVRDYLVSRGVPAANVAAVGKGEQAPIADNESAEGRATNRRVEIVVANQAQPAADSGSAQRTTLPGQALPMGSLNTR